jgi:hypothetical protein
LLWALLTAVWMGSGSTLLLGGGTFGPDATLPSGEASGYRAEVWRKPTGQRPRPSLRTLQVHKLVNMLASRLDQQVHGGRAQLSDLLGVTMVVH